MNVTIEFAGMARVLTRVPQVDLELDDTITFREILRLIGSRYPTLVGEVLTPNLDTLRPSNMLNLNGKRMIQPSEMDRKPQDGDRLILMSILAGG